MLDTLTHRLSVWHLKAAYHEEMKQVLGHITIIQRLDRAYDMLTRDERYSFSCESVRPLVFKITSPNDTYTIREGERLCTCPDAEVLCKHRLACRLIVRCIKGMQQDGLSVTVKE